MRILVLGSGGRENALAHTFNRQGHTVYCLPGNAGTQRIAEPLPAEWRSLDVNDFAKLSDFVKELDIELTVVGPEDLLNKGIANVFGELGLNLFGPNKRSCHSGNKQSMGQRLHGKIWHSNSTLCHLPYY